MDDPGPPVREYTYTQPWDPMNNRHSDRFVLREEDQAWIPFDEGNADFQIYKLWLQQGNRPRLAEIPPPPPPPPPSNEELMAVIQELRSKVDKLERGGGT